MTPGYQRPPASSGALRLHLNERSDGCSPRVLEAIRSLTAGDLGRYPAYDDVSAAAARRLGVDRSMVALTNGLDEGLLAAALVSLAGRAGSEAIIVEPSFDMYATVTSAAGGRAVSVRSADDLAFPLEDVLRAITPRTRLVFVNTPNNPSGLEVPRAAIERVAAAAAPAAVLVDEAYAGLGGSTLLQAPAFFDRFPNVIVGRTFAKTYGLAGLRAGALVGPPRAIDALRAVVPPYSLNTVAATALVAALEDEEHVARYVGEVARSRALVYGACERLGLGCWPSAGNFVLIRVGPPAPAVVRALMARGIAVRDRSSDPGCAGCIRLTAGWTHETERALAALEEALCAAR